MQKIDESRKIIPQKFEFLIFKILTNNNSDKQVIVLSMYDKNL